MTNIVLLGTVVGDFIIKLLLRILLLIDGLALDIARISYKVFYFTSRITLVSGDQIERFTNRVYLILGIALVFIIAYNLLTYIIDPEKISDKKAGAGAFIKNVLISLTIIVITPMAFVKLYALQNVIIEQGIISNIIMGTAAPGEGPSACQNSDGAPLSAKEQRACTEAVLNQGADNAVASVFTAFVIPTSGEYTAADCNDPPYSDYEYCIAYRALLGTDGEDGTISEMRDLILDEAVEDEPAVKYYFLFSTAGIGVMIFFFVSYCIELGKRAGKLAILQLLAPIPVLMEIVPGKSGSRQKWLNMTMSTYLDVFIYQATIFIVIFLITFVPKAIVNLFSSAYEGSGSILIQSFALVFVIFGLLKFGKDVPKMIEDLLGIKGGGGLSDSIKNFKLATGGLGFAGSLIGSTVGRAVRNGASTDGGFWKTMGSATAGAVSGLTRSLYHAKDINSLKDVKKIRKQVNEQLVTKKVQRDAYAFSHPGKFGSTKGHFMDKWDDVKASGRSYIGVQNYFEKRAEQERVLSEMKGIYKAEIEDAIYAKNATWNQLKSMLAQAEANNKYDDDGKLLSLGVFKSQDGTIYSQDEIKNQIKARETELRKKNTDKVSRALGRMQNLANPNQGIKGISNVYHKIDELFPGGTYSDRAWDAFITEFEGTPATPATPTSPATPATPGYKTVLDDIKEDARYQQEKVARDIAKDAKEQVEKAAKEATKNKKDS